MKHFMLRTAMVLLVAAWTGGGVRSGWAQPASEADAQVDDPVYARYERAFAALLVGRFDAAITGFEQVSEEARDPGLRAAARELARLAVILRTGGVRFVVDPGSREQPAPADRDIEGRTAGRTRFVVSTTLASVYGGAVLIDLLDVSDEMRPSVGLLLGATGAGFLGSYYGSRGRIVTESMADAYNLGLVLGIGNGLLLSSPLGLGTTEQVQTFTFSAMAVSGAAGMWLAHEVQPTRGQVAFTSVASGLGMATTGLGLLIVQPDVDGATISLLLAGGLDAGTALGISLAPEIDWSVSRARLAGLGAFLGALTGWGAAALLTSADVDDGGTVARAWGAGTLVGMWGGFGLSAFLTRGMEPERGHGVADRGGPEAPVLVAPARVPGGIGLSVSGRF